jgi:general secretion pathway protein G
MRPHRTSSRRGFSLLEIVVAVAIMAILAGVVAYSSRGVIDRGKVGKVLTLNEGLKQACATYYVDVGTYAHEYSGYGATDRQLSAAQAFAGWKGPYIEQPLTAAQNPYGGTIHLFDNVQSNGWLPGFDVDGDGTDDVAGAANMLYLSGVPAEAQSALDDALDRGIPGVASDTGRVRYSGTNVWILTYN